MKHQFCPVCNHQLTGSFDYTLKIRTLLAARSDRTQKLIRQVITAIQKENRDDITKYTSYIFLQRIHHIEDAKIRMVISQFIHEQYAKKMYGLKYLTGWMLNLNTVFEKKKAVEKKIYGNPPLKRKVKEYEPIKTNAKSGSAHSDTPALDRLRSSKSA